MKTLLAKILIVMAMVIATCSVSGAEENIPFESRHFSNAPRISAEQALIWQRSGMKMVVISVPFGDAEHKQGHVCGSVRAPATGEDSLKRLITKIPKNYLIISYCM